MTSSGMRRYGLVLMCVLGVAYVWITVLNVEDVVNDKVADGIKLALVTTLCLVGFVLGREYFRFTHTAPIILAAMILIVVLHITELTEEFSIFDPVPLLGRVTVAKRAFETLLMIGSVCLFLSGNFLSVSEITRAKEQLESNLQSLREREQRYRALFEAANDGIVIMQGHRFTQCNSKALEMFGCTEAQIIGKAPWQFSPPTQPDGRNSDEKARHKLDQVLAGKAQSFEWRHIRYDGTPFDAEISLNLVDLGDAKCVQAIVRDISRRREAEGESRRLTTVLEATSDLVSMATMDGRIIYLNKAGRRMLGWLDDEVIHTQKIAHAHPDWAYRLVKEEGLPAAVKNGTWTGETAVLGPDGTEIPVSQVITSHKSDVGDVEYFSTIVRDLREYKRIEHERLDYQRRLRSLASELSLAEERERRRIATGLHDYACQALVLSRMRIESLCESPIRGGTEELAGVCDVLDKTAQSVRELMFDLSSPTLYKFGLEAALQELLEDKLKEPHGIHYTFSDDGAPKPLGEDVRVLLFQSVRELLVNIIKHAQADKVALDIKRADDRVRVTMTDDGVGFDADDVLVTPSHDRGFGLFNIKERLDYIGGSLDIQSGPGRGSRLTLVAPLDTHVEGTSGRRDMDQYRGLGGDAI